MTKTIKGIAEELGYSKTYISKTIKANGLQSSLRKNGNKFIVDEDVEREIIRLLRHKPKTKNDFKSQTENREQEVVREQFKNVDIERDLKQSKTDINVEVFDFLREQIKQKDLQISQKDIQLEEINERLKETIIMLNDTRKELSKQQKLLVLDEDEHKNVSNNKESHDVINGLKEKSAWWQFWK